MAKDYLEPEEIRMPPPGPLKRIFGSSLEAAAQKRIDQAIREHATLPDGRVDTDLASYIEKKMTQSKAIGIREILGPGSWVVTLAGLGFIARMGYEYFGTSKEKRSELPGINSSGRLAGITAATVLTTLAIDSFRMRSRFHDGLTGELEGALQAKKNDRYRDRAKEEARREMRKELAAEMPEPSAGGITQGVEALETHANTGGVMNEAAPGETLQQGTLSAHLKAEHAGEKMEAILERGPREGATATLTEERNHASNSVMDNGR